MTTKHVQQYRWRAAHAVLVLFAASLSGVAAAQTIPDDAAVDRAEARLDRLDSAASTDANFMVGFDGATPPKKDFTLILALPFTYNSNVALAQIGAVDSFHAAPAAQLDFSRKSGSIVFLARLQADADALTERTVNNSSTLTGRFGLRLENTALGLFKPYILYAPQAIYGGGFANHVVTTHTVTLGIGGEVASASGKLTFGFDVSGARRTATLATSEQERYGVALTLKGPLSERVDWRLVQTISRRIYTGGTNIGRHDTYLKTDAVLSVKLNPKAVVAGGPEFGFDFGVTFQRNDSNRVGKSYSAWDVGPKVVLKTKF